MKSRKGKHGKTPALGSYRAPRQDAPKCLRILEGWKCIIIITEADTSGIRAEQEFIISPEQKVYRRAASWENPSLLIHSDIFAAATDIRLVRILDKRTRIHVRKQLRRRIRRFGA